MSLIGTLISTFSRDKPEESQLEQFSYGIDIDGKPLYREDVEAYVLNELERRRDERKFIEMQWQLNTNFLYGNQRCDINKYTNTIEQYELPYDSMENEVFNQIEPLYKTRLANLNKVSYAMTVKPRTSELDDISKAKISTEILRYKQNVSGFDDFKTRLFSWSEITGTAFVMSWWDSQKGDIIGEKNVIVSDENGLKNDTETVFSGDVQYGMLSPYEVFPESVYKQNIKDQRSIIVEQVMSVEDIYDLYGVKVDGETVEAYAMSTIEGAGGFGYVASVAKVTSRMAENSKKVITYFERPGRAFPKGRLIILIGKELHHYGDLPYDEIPIVAVKSDEVAGQFYGRSFIQSEIPLQRAYNGMMNTVHDYMRRLAVSTVAVEAGSIKDMDEFAENQHQPGGILVYEQGFKAPDYIDPPNLPGEVHAQISKIRNDMEYVAGISQLMVYGQKSGVTSGAAIQNLTEIDNTRLSITGENMRNAVLELSKMWLRMYKKCASGYRVLRIAGSNDAGDVIVWTNEDINSYDIKFDVENELVFSEEMQRQNFVTAYNMGIFTDADGRTPESFKKAALSRLKVNNFTDIIGINDLQRQRACRENGFARMGVPPVIEEFDDHVIHIEEHEKFVLQLDYQVLKKSSPELCRQFEEHIKEHRMNMQSQKAERNTGLPGQVL